MVIFKRIEQQSYIISKSDYETYSQIDAIEALLLFTIFPLPKYFNCLGHVPITHLTVNFWLNFLPSLDYEVLIMFLFLIFFSADILLSKLGGIFAFSHYQIASLVPVTIGRQFPSSRTQLHPCPAKILADSSNSKYVKGLLYVWELMKVPIKG